MEMKQKEQEINKRKKRLLWKEKRMKETVLNAMNPVEREIFEKELQKVHLKKSTALNDIGKTVWDTKKIRELLDQDAELEEIKRFFDENQLKPNQYNRNAIPLAAYTYWYGRGCGREDVCLWALESATTIDGLLQVQESSHLEKIAKKFISMDKYGVVAFRKMYLHEELCWTDAPNYLAAVMSGNVSLLQMFEAKDEEMTEENMEYWEYTCEWDRIPGARKTYYSIRRETIVGDFYIPGILTAAILSGSPEMLDYCIDHYDIDGASLAYGEKEALGQAVAGEGKELTEYMLEDLQLDGLLDTIFTGERSTRRSKIIGNLGQELGITFKRVERQVIEDILRMLEDMKVVVVIGNLYRDNYGTKYMITVPFLVNQIAWLIANHVVKTGEKRKEESVRQINEIALKSVVISHTAYHLWHKTCYYYRDDKTEVDLVLLDQEDLRLEELQASLVDINITNHADTAYEKGQRMKEVNPYFFEKLVYGIDERIILYLGPTNKKKGLTNVMDFLESYQQRNIKTEKYLDEMEKMLMDEQKQ